MASVTTSGSGWRLAKSLIQFAHELDQFDPAWQCLGTVGDAAHQSEGGYSDHNPTMIGPDGVGIVRAIDIRFSTQAKADAVFDRVNVLYNAHDPRVFRYGYVHMDGRITTWDDDPRTTWHLLSGDEGHLHLSLTSTGWPTPPAYVPAVDSTAAWGLLNPTPVAQSGDDPMAWVFTTKHPTSGAIRYWSAGANGVAEHSAAEYGALKTLGTPERAQVSEAVIAANRAVLDAVVRAK